MMLAGHFSMVFHAKLFLLLLSGDVMLTAALEMLWDR